MLFTRRDVSPEDAHTEHYRPWKPYDVALAGCVRMGETAVYAPQNVIGGYSRPYDGPNMWVSRPLAEDPQPWVELRWDDPVTVSEVDVLLDASIEIDLINLHHHHTPQRVMPGLVTSYQLLVETPDGWDKIAEVDDNHRRTVKHALERPVAARAVRLVTTRTGSDQARVVNLRVR